MFEQVPVYSGCSSSTVFIVFFLGWLCVHPIFSPFLSFGRLVFFVWSTGHEHRACGTLRGALSIQMLRAAKILSQRIVSLNSPVLDQRGSGKAYQMYERALEATTQIELSASCSSLVAHVKDGCFSTMEECSILRRLSLAKLRHEALLESCLWRVFKKPYGSSGDCSDLPLNVEVPPEELAGYTASAFRIMAEHRLTRDPQLLSIGLGRCIELARWMTLQGVSEVFNGLHYLELQHFTISQVNLSNSPGNLTAGERMHVSSEKGDEAHLSPTTEELTYQPNLIDIISCRLEMQIPSIVMEVAKRDKSLNKCKRRGLSENRKDIQLTIVEQTEIDLHEKEMGILSILKGFSFLGIQFSETFTYLASLCQHSTDPAFYIAALQYVCKIDSRTVDVLHFEERRSPVLDNRRIFLESLCERLMSLNKLSTHLKRDSSSVLHLRKLFESCEELWAVAPSLWDCDTHQGVLRSGKLFNPRYNVKHQKIIRDHGNAERFIPPQFKTWISPLTQRSQRSSSPTRGKFGVRRVSSNYIKAKQKKYCPALKLS
eukprot:gene6420-4627_t